MEKMDRTTLEIENGSQVEIDFLFEGIHNDERLRSEAQNILDSYSHPWDILAEALQNSVDGIEQRWEKDQSVQPLIQIDFNCAFRTLRIYDTGIGIPQDQFREILIPHVSFKKGKNTRGEKGVGLTFICFSSNKLGIETCDGKELCSGNVAGASSWVKGNQAERPKLKDFSVRPFDGSSRPHRYFTELTIQVAERDDSEFDLFDHTQERLIHLLRTKTAIGNTGSLYGSEIGQIPLDIMVRLTYTGKDGIPGETVSVPFRYAAPHDYISKNSWLEFQKYLELRQTPGHEKKARGKSIVLRGSTEKGGRKIKYYAFASSRTNFDEISKEHNLYNGDELDITPGIFISTKRMPTGIVVPPPRTRATPYWFNLFIMLEDDGLRFDLGRKALRGRAVEMFKNIALKEVWAKMVPHISEIMPEPVGLELQREKELQELREKVKLAPSLDYAKIQYLKEPSNEQSVIAIFHELLGAGLLEGYRTYHNSAFDQYDSIVNYRIKKSKVGRNQAGVFPKDPLDFDIIVEFKYEASAILDDIEEGKKHINEIKLLVCWKLDKRKFKEEHIEIEDLEPDDVVYYGATHRLIFPNIQSIRTLDVLCLEEFLKNLPG
ncbi:MAG: ATP-binding protein [candidate division Zixibacteria bacterium]|nr:ATP-binding protein [candidate division Zixibacteria bacterium]